MVRIPHAFELGVGNDVHGYNPTLEANKLEAVTLQAPYLIRTQIRHSVPHLSYQVNGTHVSTVLDIEHTLNLESEGHGVLFCIKRAKGIRGTLH